MTSTERALEYCSLELDDPQYFNKATCCDSIVPVEWPNQGSVAMNEMHLSYPSRKDPVLKGITLNIKDGEKIALVGRTVQENLLCSLHYFVSLSRIQMEVFRLIR